MAFNVFSCFSGIEAASVAFEPLGFKTVGLSEVDPFCCELLKQKIPGAVNYGDITKHREWELPRSIDLVCGGPPCQSFSLAGLRKGMEEPRGNLSLTYLSFLDRVRPRWVLIENVLGILSSNNGRDFGTILGGLAECGYGFAYAVLNAQNFGVPQRRRRVFIVGHSGGDWKRAGAVLFNPQSVFGNPEESRKEKSRITERIRKGSENNGQAYRMTAFGEYVEDGSASTIKARDYKDATDLVSSFYCVHGKQDPISIKNKSLPLGAKDQGHAIISEFETFDNHPQDSRIKPCDTPALNAKAGTGGGNLPLVLNNKVRAVRRLTPVECERLQGFPDNWTRIAYRNKPPELCPDGPRYKAIGNSWAVPVVRWIGERIKEVDQW
tara:strand:+ start:1248 stop:2387 length:1140 start_codon:yes stop_codon:yes gene_type:complete